MADDAQVSAAGERLAALPVRGRVDGLGRLVEADPRLAALHRAAGGQPDGTLVIPQLAEIVGLATQIDSAVARLVTAATDDHDVTLATRAWREGDDVLIAIDEWNERAPHQPPLADDAGRHYDALRARADWTWEADNMLRLTAMGGALGDAQALIGRSLTAWLRLIPDAHGSLAIFDALSGHRAFAGQRAQTTDGGVDYVLAAAPVFDSRGRFGGFRGVAELLAADGEPAPDDFDRFIDQKLRSSLGHIVDGADAIHAQAHGALRRDYADYAADIAVAARHLLGLIDDLVDLEAVERGSFTIEVKPIDLAKVARRALALLAAAAAARAIELSGPGENDSIPAAGDERRVLQIIVNLVGNAIRYAPEHSRVRVDVEQASGLAALVVTDQGKGIAAADQRRIFEKFDRLDADEPGGSGLGLYIARRLARIMGGDIAVDSAPGQGARFTLTLPAG